MRDDTENYFVEAIIGGGTISILSLPAITVMQIEAKRITPKFALQPDTKRKHLNLGG